MGFNSAFKGLNEPQTNKQTNRQTKQTNKQTQTQTNTQTNKLMWFQLRTEPTSFRNSACNFEYW